MKTFHTHRIKPVRRLLTRVGEEWVVIGLVRAVPGGTFQFLPSMQFQCHGRRPSRKKWEDPDKAIPRWARSLATIIEHPEEEKEHGDQ